MLHAVIMAGGSGTRFWPQSRVKMPKQLLTLSGNRTLIQQTYDRCDGMIAADQSWVVTNLLQVEQTRTQLPDVPGCNVLVEPAARNTAPCVGLAAIHVLQQDPSGIMFVMPADHVISTHEDFQVAAQAAVSLVDQDAQRLVLFGVPPSFPSTGYGYIERGERLGASEHVFEVRSFREKPPAETAQQYLDAGHFYWNCGIFCWKAKTILDQLQQHEPDTYSRLMRLAAVIGTDDYNAALDVEFPQMNSIAVDRAVLERADQVCVIEAPFSWDDVGSWLAVPRLLGTDEDGTAADGLVRSIDSKNCIIRTTDDHLVATLGMEDCIIVHTRDATLVARRDDSERIKELLEILKDRGDTQFL
ncbi:MAG: NTP transferase domain-containing protein [Fuerstiella sp.]|nr:NTP transferase domain-containing protein [Fuerstiella sp.]